MKKIILTTIFIMAATSAHATCGPKFELEASTSDSSGSYSYDNDRRNNRFGMTLTWNLGDDYCEEQERQDYLGKIQNVERTKINNLRQKISVCSDFSPQTAPASIIRFCGDLL